jgi:hypothetical protein
LPKITEFICYRKSRNTYVTWSRNSCYLKSRNLYDTKFHGFICYLKAQNSCYQKSRNSCYLKSQILTDMQRVLCLFLRGLSNDASVSQNMQRRTIQRLINNEMRKDLEGIRHGVMEVLSQNLSVGSVKYFNHDIKCPDWDSSRSPSALFPVTVRRLA